MGNEGDSALKKKKATGNPADIKREMEANLREGKFQVADIELTAEQQLILSQIQEDLLAIDVVKRQDLLAAVLAEVGSDIDLGPCIVYGRIYGSTILKEREADLYFDLDDKGREGIISIIKRHIENLKVE